MGLGRRYGIAKILSKVEEHVVWLEDLLDAKIAVVPKVDVDTTLSGQRPLCVFFPVVYRNWSSACIISLRNGVSPDVLESCFTSGERRDRCVLRSC